MKEWLNNLLSNSDSVSTLRVMSIISLLVAIVLVFIKYDGYQAFLVAAFGGKVGGTLSDNLSKKG